MKKMWLCTLSDPDVRAYYCCCNSAVSQLPVLTEAFFKYPVACCYPYLLRLIFQNAQYSMSYACSGCGQACGLLISPNGTLSDGSGLSLYANSANCEWMIAPPGALQVTITFANVSTQTRNDVVRVFQCTALDCSEQLQLAELFGLHFMTQTITSTTGFMKVAFTSDSTVNYDGFSASWSSVSTLLLFLQTHKTLCISAYAHADQLCEILIFSYPITLNCRELGCHTFKFILMKK